jgi:hypothetical protein
MLDPFAPSQFATNLSPSITARRAKEAPFHVLGISPPGIIAEELGPVLIVHPSATGFLPSMQTSSN